MTIWIWDAEKASRNLTKREVSFLAAAFVLSDPLAMTTVDPHEDGNRWQTIGRAAQTSEALLFVVHTEPQFCAAASCDEEPIGRIISA